MPLHFETAIPGPTKGEESFELVVIFDETTCALPYEVQTADAGCADFPDHISSL